MTQIDNTDTCSSKELAANEHSISELSVNTNSYTKSEIDKDEEDLSFDQDSWEKLSSNNVTTKSVAREKCPDEIVHMAQWQRPRNLDVFPYQAIKPPSRIMAGSHESLGSRKDAFVQGVIHEISFLRSIKDLKITIQVRRVKGAGKDFTEKVMDAIHIMNMSRIYVNMLSNYPIRIEKSINEMDFKQAAEQTYVLHKSFYNLKIVVDKLEKEFLPILLKFHENNSNKCFMLGGEVRSIKLLTHKAPSMMCPLDVFEVWNKSHRQVFEDNLIRHYSMGQNTGLLINMGVNVAVAASLCASTGGVTSPIAIAVIGMNVVDAVVKIITNSDRARLRIKAKNDPSIKDNERELVYDDIEAKHKTVECISTVMCAATSTALVCSNYKDIVVCTRSSTKAFTNLLGKVKSRKINLEQTADTANKVKLTAGKSNDVRTTFTQLKKSIAKFF